VFMVPELRQLGAFRGLRELPPEAVYAAVGAGWECIDGVWLPPQETSAQVELLAEAAQKRQRMTHESASSSVSSTATLPLTRVASRPPKRPIPQESEATELPENTISERENPETPAIPSFRAVVTPQQKLNSLA